MIYYPYCVFLYLNVKCSLLTLKTIVTALEANFSFETLSKNIKIKCFTDNPNIQSTLKFLRKTPWAREKVEQLYIQNKNKIHS